MLPTWRAALRARRRYACFDGATRDPQAYGYGTELGLSRSCEDEAVAELSLAAGCHVVVEKDWFDKLAPAGEDEEDMLDLAFGLTHTSRLGCQIRMSEALDGLVVKLPAATRNMMVDK